MILPSKIGNVVMMVAGGTGGHIVPAIAVGDALRHHGYLSFVVSDERGKQLLADMKSRYPSLAIPSVSPFSRNPIKMIGRLFRLLGCLILSLITVLWMRPDIIIGFGGYPTVAPVLAGRICRVPVVLHEQNARLGRANRFLVPMAQGLALSWPSDRKRRTPTKVTGTPVRNPFLVIGRHGYTPPAKGEVIRLAIIGGSLGARVFAKTIPAAIAKLPKEIQECLIVIQQVRREDMASVKRAYADLDDMLYPPRLVTFVKNMPEVMEDSHLIIGRAGASFVAELAVAGRPAILVPYPHAMDDHQTVNARLVAKAGGGWLMPDDKLTDAALAELLTKLLKKPKQLADAASQIQQLARPQAAQHIADMASVLAQGGKL